MTLLLQLDGEVPESPHQRVFYVFACLQKQCRRKQGGVRAIRGVGIRKAALAKEEELKKRRLDEEEAARKRKEEEASRPLPGDMLFGSGLGNAGAKSVNPFSMVGGAAAPSPFGNPFSTNSAATTAQMPPSKLTTSSTSTTTTPSTLPTTFAAALKLNSKPIVPRDPEPLFYGPPEPWPNPLPTPPFPHYYLDADYEELSATPESLLQRASQSVQTDPTSLLDSSSPPSGGGSSDDWGGYEKSTLDTTFQKFSDCTSENPDQVLRYEHKGVPLLYSKTDAVGKLLSPLNSAGEALKNVPGCLSCGKQRFFEFQLMPHAIAMLEVEDVGLDGMEWGTIIVASCTCVPRQVDGNGNGVGYVEEWVGVQWEQQKK
ncbi:programmed cell death protein 2 [Tirmania nivea]|nr:programmed cell death protein 2 [Tirmania nivea]